MRVLFGIKWKYGWRRRRTLLNLMAWMKLLSGRQMGFSGYNWTWQCDSIKIIKMRGNRKIILSSNLIIYSLPPSFLRILKFVLYSRPLILMSWIRLYLSKMPIHLATCDASTHISESSPIWWRSHSSIFKDF